SFDGISWSTKTGPGLYPSRVVYGNGTFFVAGSASQVSTDGMNWTFVNSGFNSATFGKGLFVGVGWDGQISTSSSGTQWTAIELSGSSGDLFAAGFGNDLYLAGGLAGVLRTSTDGTNWSTQSSSLTHLGPLYGVAFALDRFVAVGDWEIGPDGRSEASPLLSSADGINWARGSPVSGSAFRAVAFGNRNFVALGDFGDVVLSPDGI